MKNEKNVMKLTFLPIAAAMVSAVNGNDSSLNFTDSDNCKHTLQQYGHDIANRLPPNLASESAAWRSMGTLFSILAYPHLTSSSRNCQTHTVNGATTQTGQAIYQGVGCDFVNNTTNPEYTASLKVALAPLVTAYWQNLTAVAPANYTLTCPCSNAVDVNPSYKNCDLTAIPALRQQCANP